MDSTLALPRATPPLLGQCLPTPVSYCWRSLGGLGEDSRGLLLPGLAAGCWSQVPKNQTTGVPGQAHVGPTSASAPAAPWTPSLQPPRSWTWTGPMASTRAAPHREGSQCLSAGNCLGPALDVT